MGNLGVGSILGWVIKIQIYFGRFGHLCWAPITQLKFKKKKKLNSSNTTLVSFQQLQLAQNFLSCLATNNIKTALGIIPLSHIDINQEPWIH